MISSILVPLDGSPVSEQVIKHACRLARTTGAELALVQAAPYTPLASGMSSPSRVTVRDAEAYLSSLQRRLRREGFAVSTLALHADPLHAISYAARVRAAGVVVMCTHGRSAWGRLLQGSVAEDVLRHSAIPVLIVHATEPPTMPRSEPYRRILVPLDGTAFAEAALAYLGRGDLGREHEVILLHTPPPGKMTITPALPGYATERARAEQYEVEAARYLARAADTHLHGVSYRTKIMNAHPASAIRRVAETEGIDLIVMATHGRKGLAHLAHGSVAEQVVRHAASPVLLLPGAWAEQPTHAHADVQPEPVASRS